MIREIIQHPDERLRQIAAPVPQAMTDKHLNAAIDLAETFMHTPNCYGLAATQLGIPLRIIVVDISPSRCDTVVMFNPVIEQASHDLQQVQDGCKSVKSGTLFETTKRPKRLTVTWLDVMGHPKRRKFTGLIAACIHHEVDHLDGIIFLDRVAAPRAGWGAL
jgi:peptide deformylase